MQKHYNVALGHAASQRDPVKVATCHCIAVRSQAIVCLGWPGARRPSGMAPAMASECYFCRARE
jgi:hypothetical protein